MKKYLALAFVVAGAGSVWAGDSVTDAMQQAYAPYRAALFRTNSNDQAESRLALAQSQQAWEKLAAQYAGKPPAPYDRDSAFASSLAEVSKVYATAMEQVSTNQLTAAHETLEKARDIMAEMRRRNQVIVFSDHMNAYHAQMENVLINGPKILLQPNGLQQLTAMVGALDYLAKRLTSEAPVNYARNEEFIEAARATGKSVADLQAALFSQDLTAVKAALPKIKAPYSKFFLKFG